MTDFDDSTERFERWKEDNISSPPSFHGAALLLSRLQKSFRLLSGDLNQESLEKVLRRMGRETAALTQIFTALQLPLASTLSASVGKLVMHLFGDVKSLDASTLRTLSHALDGLRGCSTDMVRRTQLQSLPIKVLVLDDDPICRKFMQRALGIEPIDPVLCETAEQALNCLEAYDFDVVFSDILMPEVDGFAFVERLRQIKTHERTPVIFVTALNDLVTRSKSRLTGGCDFIAKPINPAEITVKAITFAWKGRLSRGHEGVEPKPETLSPTPPGSVREAPEPRRGSSRVGVISISPGGLVESVSRDGASILGYAAEELVNSEAARFLSERGQASEAKALTVGWLAQQAKRSTSTLVLALSKTGEKAAVQIRVSKSATKDDAPFVCLLTLDPEPSS